MDSQDIDQALRLAEQRTRRERIATAIFAGMHSCSVCQPSAHVAVSEADKLIAALDSTNDGAR